MTISHHFIFNKIPVPTANQSASKLISDYYWRHSRSPRETKMTFEVGVKLQTGERFEIEADGDETVADLKNRIEVSFYKGVKLDGPKDSKWTIVH